MHHLIQFSFQPKQAAVGEIVTPRRVLLFGSGRVARPIVEVFAGKENTVLTIATNDEKQVQELIDATGVPARNVIFKKFVYPQDNENLNEMIKNCDIVVSLLPAAMHTMIAEEAINQSRNMVTASYVSPEMKKLDGLAREKNVTILNEGIE